MMIKIEIPDSELHFTFSRSSGAGGQNINKVNTKATLHWDLGNSVAITFTVKQRFKEKFGHAINTDGLVVITSQEQRTQKGNVDACLEKLHHMIRQAMIVPKIRHKTKPKRSAVQKRLNSKKIHSEKKKNRKVNF